MYYLSQYKVSIAFGIILFFRQVAIGEVAYTITDLGTLGRESSARGINSNGLITGLSGVSSNDHAFVYSNGTMNDLGTLGGTFSAGYSINASGQITGESFVDGNFYPGHAFVYSNGQMSDLGTLGGIGSYGSAINDSGQVAGSVLLPDGQTWHAFLYSNGQMSDIGTLGGTRSEARAINNSGQVAGSADITGDTAVHVYLYTNGVMQDLGFSGTVQGMNASGQITGWTDDANGNFVAFLYSNGTMKELGNLGGAYSFGYGINGSGDVVGNVLLSDNSTYHAFVYTNGAMTDLNTLIDHSSGWTLNSAKGINDLGQIVGDGTFNGQTEAFLLTPAGASPNAVPEPAAVGVLGLGSLMLLLRRHRGRAAAK